MLLQIEGLEIGEKTTPLLVFFWGKEGLVIAPITCRRGAGRFSSRPPGPFEGGGVSLGLGLASDWPRGGSRVDSCD